MWPSVWSSSHLVTADVYSHLVFANLLVLAHHVVLAHLQVLANLLISLVYDHLDVQVVLEVANISVFHQVRG